MSEQKFMARIRDNYKCNENKVRSDSFGLLLMLFDYPSSQALWILFTDQRPTLALGLLFVLPVLYLFADVLTLPVVFKCAI